MNVTQIEEIVKNLVSDVINSSVENDQFIYELMAAYGHRRTTVSRIKSGERNLAKVTGEVRAKRHIYFKYSDSNKVFSDIDDMKKEPSVTREKIRFIIATDFSQFVAVDTRTHDTLDIEFSELGKHFDFFLPWAGMEKAVYQGDNPADVKAAEKMAKLFDLIKVDNFNEENKNDTAALHSLNVFLTRLLFCFFAEDTGIFRDNQFSAELESHTKVDGSDVDSYLNRLFKVLDTSKENRHDLPDYLAKFEYVNGGLFADAIDSPKFSTKSRRMLIECGSELDWSGINPDIFGSMIQAVVHPDQRGGMGMHYTSVINIMKVIEPLFLDDLYAELENIAENIDPKLKPSRLRKLHDRIASLKIFDPACGSGNFLIIAFKELRKLEMEIIKQLQEFKKNESQDDFFDDISLNSSFSRIKLSQFYGIELDDFAHEVAILSLWLAEHQMNIEFKAEFGECAPTLPLHRRGNITCSNACRIDWEQICPNAEEEIYILGNPPYVGQRNQNEYHKSDLDLVFKGLQTYKKLDYISCFFYKASKYIKGNQKFAFVTTNSICQGIQVDDLWPKLFSKGVEIFFAYSAFKWVNNAKQNAGVTCTIIGIRNKSEGSFKHLFGEGYKKKVTNINSYLVDGPNVIVKKSNKALSSLPKMHGGNQPREGGHLMLSDTEKNEICLQDERVTAFIRPLVGSSEFIKGTRKWCIWITDEMLEQARAIPLISERIDKVYNHRLNGNTVEKSFINVPHKFVTTKEAFNHQIIIPTVSSERREYIPIGILDAKVAISSRAFAIFDAELYVLAILTSKLHMVWVKALAGRLREDITYSSVLCYNTFPLPELTTDNIEQLTLLSLELLTIRENYLTMSLSEQYDPDKMPQELRNQHNKINDYVDSIFSDKPFKSDEERLGCLLGLYSELIGEEKNA